MKREMGSSKKKPHNGLPFSPGEEEGEGGNGRTCSFARPRSMTLNGERIALADGIRLFRDEVGLRDDE